MAQQNQQDRGYEDEWPDVDRQCEFCGTWFNDWFACDCGACAA